MRKTEIVTKLQMIDSQEWINRKGYRFLNAISSKEEELVKLVSVLLDANDSGQLSNARAKILRMLKNLFKGHQIPSIVASWSDMQKAFSELEAALGSGALLDELKLEFESYFTLAERASRDERPEDCLQAVVKAGELQRSLGMAVRLAEHLASQVKAPEVPDGYVEAKIVFQVGDDLGEIQIILSSLHSIYQSIAYIAGEDPNKKPLRVHGIESGSIDLDLIGVKELVLSLIDLVKYAGDSIRQRTTRLGKLERVAKESEILKRIAQNVSDTNKLESFADDKSNGIQENLSCISLSLSQIAENSKGIEVGGEVYREQHLLTHTERKQLPEP